MNININITRQDGMIETVEWNDVCVNHIRRVDNQKRAEFNNFCRDFEVPNEAIQKISSQREFFDIKGGTTIIAYTRNGKSKTTLSTCSPKENFCRRTGIGAAVVNFVNNHIKSGPYILDSFDYPVGDNTTYTFNFVYDDSNTDKYWFLRAIARTRKASRQEFLAPYVKVWIKK